MPSTRPYVVYLRAIYFLSILAVAGLLACGGEQSAEDEKASMIEATPAAVEKPETAEATSEVAKEKANEPTPEPTATAPPVPTPTATRTSTVAPAEDQAEEPPRVDVPNRGYNVLGSPDAPITMFEFSDFT